MDFTQMKDAELAIILYALYSVYVDQEETTRQSLINQIEQEFRNRGVVLDEDVMKNVVCDDCSGTGLMSDINGEPDICSTCRGNTVVPTVSQNDEGSDHV